MNITLFSELRGLIVNFHIANPYTATQDNPIAPSALEIESTTSPVTTDDETPEFSAIYNDPDLSDIAERYRIQITATSTDWTNLVWDSGKINLTSSTTEGDRCPDISYSGSSLNHNVPYFWRIKFWDDENNEGDWSAENSLFVITNDIYIQDLSYTYDNVGNITRIIDNSETNASKIANYSYDSLYRLIRASSTNAATADYLEDYSYDSIGNLTNKSDQGDYEYDGNQGTSYANPHAATQINTSAQTYDKNGNLTSDGIWTYTWDYRDRLTQASNGSITMKYGYDHNNNRIWMNDGTATTTYVSKYYSLTGATTTRHIFINKEAFATIEADGLSTSTYYLHTDHLGGTNVITDEDGAVVQLIDYYPFGDIRIDEKAGDFNEKRKYTGHEYDEATDLNYMMERYQNSVTGRFLSQDPTLVYEVSKDWLTNPQKLNGYSYVTNNPIKYTDPFGLFEKDTGTIEKGDTPSIITNSLNEKWGTSYDWGQIVQLNPGQLQGTRFEDTIGRSIIPNNNVPDVTNKLNALNQTHGQCAKDNNYGEGIWGRTKFGWKFREGGAWDLKSQEDTIFYTGKPFKYWDGYVYNGEQISYDAPGNIHYGYVGHASGYGSLELLLMGDVVQNATNYINNKIPFRDKRPFPTLDPASDQNYIRMGYNLYN